MCRLSPTPCWILSCVVLVSGCSAPEPPPPPVATVEVALAQAELPFPEWRSLGLKWRPSSPLGAEGTPSVFLHLLSEDGKLERTFDHSFPQEWAVGSEIQYDIEIYQSALGPPLGAGDYDLVLGLYGADGRRWPLEIPGASELPRWEYKVARVSVPSVGPEAPAFEFSAAWQALEPGGDLQVLGRRWLRGEGSIQVLNLEVPGTVKLRVTVPGDEAGAGGWQLRGEEDSPSLEITSSCSGAVRSLEVPGSFDVVLPVFPLGADLTCELVFLANYKLVHVATSQERTLALEVLAWTPAEL